MFVLLWLLIMFLRFRWGTGSDRTVCVCVCVCVCVAALHWQHVWNGGGCLSLVSASFGPGWSRSVSFCTSRPSSSLRCTAHTYCPQSPQVRHYTSPSLSHTRKPGNIREFLMPGKVWNFTYKCCVQTMQFGVSKVFFYFFLNKSLRRTKAAFSWTKIL